MRINSNYPANIARLYQTQQTQSGQTEKATETKAAKQDTLQLSDQAQEIYQLIKETKDLPEIREDKIAQIKESINNNTYRVSAQQLAASMLSSEKE